MQNWRTISTSQNAMAALDALIADASLGSVKDAAVAESTPLTIKDHTVLDPASTPKGT